MTLGRGLRAALLAATALALVSCARPAPHADDAGAGSSDAAGAVAAARELPASHREMLIALAALRDRTADENHWLGAGPLAAARARLQALPPGAVAGERWPLLLELGEHELRMGEQEAAIQHLLDAHQLLPELPPAIEQRRRLESVLRLGIAWLRFGETRNCQLRHNAESCILPIRGAGVHVDQEGSRHAIRYLEEVAAATDRSSPLNVKAVWLLNLAYMTLGLYPGQVPEAWRIPEPVLDSGEPFTRLANVAPEAGVATTSLSGGVVFDDLDGDRRPDLFVTSFDTAASPRFFHNRGDGSFEDRSAAAGLEGLFGGLQVIHGDYDNDGDADLYVLRGAWLGGAGRHPNSLLRNDGGVFTDVTLALGVSGAVAPDRDGSAAELRSPASGYPTQTAAWADYDHDGDLDLFVGNEHGGEGVDVYRDLGAPIDAPCQLFRNDGAAGFTEVAAGAGVDARAYVKGLAWGDVDEDRWPDLYLSVLGGPNRLYRNRGDGSFEDVTAAAGVAEPEHSFPTWFFDYDQDGHLDLWVSSYRGAPGSVALVAASWFGQPVPWDLARLYRGDGRGGFTDVTARVGLGRLDLAMGASFGDLDGDGFPEVYLGTGYPDYEALMPNVLYRNDRGRRFVDVTFASGLGHLQKGHGVAFADYDLDGDLDVFEQMGGAFPGDAFADALYRNPGNGARWLELELEGRRSNRSAIGARVRVDAVDADGRRWSAFAWVGSGSSFGGNPLRPHFGLGRAVAIERLEVYWPTTDLTQTFAAVPLDSRYRVVEDEPQLSPIAPPAAGRAGGAGGS